MKFLIKVYDAKAFISLLHKCTDRNNKTKEDPRGHEIDTWYSVVNPKGEILFVHNKDQWKKCCVELTANEENDTVSVKFYYFESTKEEDRSPLDNSIIFGRFTELVLTHFYEEINRIAIC